MAEPGTAPVPTLVLVGGFLGAGKTTLVLAAARRLAARGLRVGLVTNDQGRALVDTALARATDLPTEEVTGGCFCCKLSDLLRATDALARARPDVVFAEPVGSCIDLSATIVHPLLADFPGRFHVAPLTVLVDPARARTLLARDAEPDFAYLFRHQIDEADIVCWTKRDLGGRLPPLNEVVGLSVSAVTGEGVDLWLQHVLDVERPSGTRGLNVDYQRYAAAEASLGWLNAQVSLALDPPASPLTVVGGLLERLDAALTEAGAGIAHAKVLDQTATGYVRASLCENGGTPAVAGSLDAAPARTHRVLVNVRARVAPDVLADVVRRCLAPLADSTTASWLEAFAPAPPRPERRVAVRSRG